MEKRRKFKGKTNTEIAKTIIGVITGDICGPKRLPIHAR